MVPPGDGWQHDPYGGEIDGGSLYGRAAAVSKSDFASFTFALRALEIYEDDRVLEHVGNLAPHFAARIAALARHPLVGHGRAVGLVGAIELMADPAQKTPFDPALKVGARVVEHALDYGVILRPLGDVISFCPPLIIDRAETDFLFDAVTRALDRTQAELGGKQRRKVA